MSDIILSQPNSSNAVLSTKEVAVAVDEINNVVETGGASIASRELAKTAMHLDSADAAAINDFQSTLDVTKTHLANTTLAKIIDETVEAHFDSQEDAEEARDRALTVAAYTLNIVAGDPRKSLEMAMDHLSMPSFAIDNGVVVDPGVGSPDYLVGNISLDGFEPAHPENYTAIAVMVNALSAVGTSFEEAFFPTRILPPGQDGYDLNIPLPSVMRPIQRPITEGGSGAAGKEISFERKTLVEALTNPSILEEDILKALPIRNANSNDALLVSTSVVPAETEYLYGTSVQYSPIKFGVTFDLIGGARIPELAGTYAFDETDILDTTLGVKDIYVELHHDDSGTPNLYRMKVDVSQHSGSIFTQTREGSPYDYQLTFDDIVTVSSSVPVVSVDPTGISSFPAVVRSLYSLGASDDFLVKYRITLNGKINIENGSGEVFANRVEIVGVSSGGTELDPATLQGYFDSISGLGWVPNARLRNTNYRLKSMIMDSNRSLTYRYPLVTGSPIVSQQALNAPANTSVNYLELGNRMRLLNQALTALETLHTNLKVATAAGGTLPPNYSTLGQYFVTPTLVEKTLNVPSVVTSLASKDALDNLRGHLVAAITNMANEMLVKSNYIVGLEVTENNSAEYEFIIVTDIHIASHLLLEGDPRTLGTGHSFLITTVPLASMRGKLYMGLRRKRRGNISPMDMGFRLYSPSVVTEINAVRRGAHIKEIHLLPRASTYTTLPVLGYIEVQNLEQMFYV